MAAKIDLNHKVHVLTKKEELDSVRVPGKVIVVLDILFATTTMVAALAGGAAEVLPVADEAAARAAGARYAVGRYVLAGELYGALADEEVFDSVRLDEEAHTLVWPNGADFDPAMLYNWVPTSATPACWRATCCRWSRKRSGPPGPLKAASGLP